MKSNLDVWAVQTDPTEIYTALEQVKDGISIIYSNCTCNFKIGSQEISTRQFDTFLYNEESDVLIMLMRGGKATKEDMIKYLEEKGKKYHEITFANPVEEYENTDDIDPIWFAREKYVLEDAIKDSKKNGITSCEFYPFLTGSLNFGYISNSNNAYSIDGRLFRGLVKLDDKLVLIINQRENIDANGKMRNMSNQDVLDILKSNGIECTVITDKEPEIYNKRKIK